MLQKLLNTNNGLAKVIFISISYIIFWGIFYGWLFLIPEDFFEVNNISGAWTIIYILLFVPWLSFRLYSFYQKNKYLETNILISLHLLVMILSILLFFKFWLAGALNFGGF